MSGGVLDRSNVSGHSGRIQRADAVLEDQYPTVMNLYNQVLGQVLAF